MQRHITIPSEGEYVTAELFTPETKIVAAMLISHGWTSKNAKYRPLAEKLSSHGVATLAINLRGHGDSRYPISNYSRQNHLQDILMSINYLKMTYSTTPLIVLGKSYSGYLSAIACTILEIDYLILSQPALYPDDFFNFPNEELIKHNPNIFRSSNESMLNNRALSAISQFSSPLLIVKSQNDEEVFNSPEYYIQASSKNKKREIAEIKDSDHPLSRPEWLLDYQNTIMNWLVREKVISM